MIDFSKLFQMSIYECEILLKELKNDLKTLRKDIQVNKLKINMVEEDIQRSMDKLEDMSKYGSRKIILQDINNQM